ncbi:unnamed protein product, partial [marine sediment metagenome]
LRHAASTLEPVSLLHADFERTITPAKSGDFVYLDPPYPPLNETAFFTHYTKERFGIDGQQRVAVAFKKLSEAGALVMMTNAGTPEIRKLYPDYYYRDLETSRYVAANGIRYRVSDVVISNFPLR